MNFYSELIKTILLNAKNDFSGGGNYDESRFGKIEKPVISFNVRIRKLMEKMLNAKNYHVVHQQGFLADNLDRFDEYFEGLEYLYNELEDDLSKKLLLQLLAYKALGYTKVKLPLNEPAYWEGIGKIESISDKNDFIDVDVRFMQWRLHLIDLGKIGTPVKLYLSAMGAYTDFILRQYEYKNGNKLIKAEKGDYVIDAGGCWGDTALYFANEVGPAGKVFTYEFIPSNIRTMRKNLSLNPELEPRVNLIENPVWEKSDETMYYIDAGPGSRVFMKEEEVYDGKVDSLSIDQLVDNLKIDKIDFIKMDIEGAEPYALRGAVGTIKRFKPKLAIAIYHSMDDFTNIPRFINELGLGYKLYLAHCSIHEEETVLFAEIPV